MSNQHRDLCFTTCFNDRFFEGAKGTILSIRNFYNAADAQIVAFAESPNWRLEQLCRTMAVELHYFRDIHTWAIPLIYSRREYIENVNHFYHPAFRPHAALPYDTERASLGFETIRHLHPLNVKAYCTGFCLNVKRCEYVVHIDSDAFLLSKVDGLLDEIRPNTLVGFDDGTDDLPNLEMLYQVKKPIEFESRTYAFNAGVVFYRTGEGIRTLTRDFMHYIESCYHFTLSGNWWDQSVLRALVAKHHILGNIQFELRDAVNWNPTCNRAEELAFSPEAQEWRNLANGKKQYIWHGAGQEKLWSGRCTSESVIKAWKYIGGAVCPKSWWDVKGSLVFPDGDYVPEHLCGDAVSGIDSRSSPPSGSVSTAVTEGPRTMQSHHPSMARGLQIKAVDDGYIVYNPDSDRIHHLNPTAALVLELCNGRNPEAELPVIVQSVYDLAQPPVEQVMTCLGTLKEEGLICVNKGDLS